MELANSIGKESKGRFYGKAVLEPNTINNFPIAIYNELDVIIGNINGQEYLYNTIEEYTKDDTKVWGYIWVEINEYNGTEKTYGRVYIPAKCTEMKIEKELAEFKSRKLIFTHKL